MIVRQETKYIVVHCAATKPSLDIGASEIREWHLAKGWADIGYHYVIRRDGAIELGRNPAFVGAHVAGYNGSSVGVCLVGGLTETGAPFLNRPDLYEPQQLDSLRYLLEVLHRMYLTAQIVGHRDLSPDQNKDGKIEPWEYLKSCPGFNVGEWFRA